MREQIIEALKQHALGHIEKHKMIPLVPPRRLCLPNLGLTHM